MGTVVDWDGAAIDGGSPLEAIIGKEVHYLHDRAPMGVVAEVIRNDMAEPLGIVVYDEASKEVQRFRESQVEIRDDGRVLVLPSWFRDSRVKILGRIEEMEAVVPVVRKARARGKALAPEEAAAAVARAPYEVQRYVDEAVVLRSELIGKLHDLARRQAESRSELGRVQSPGLFGRGDEEERKAAMARLRRSLRLNDLTIFAIKDFLLKMETCALFPRDPRAHAMFKEDELKAAETSAAEEAPPSAEWEGEEEVAEFEAEPEGAFEEEPFEALDEAEPVEEFAPVSEAEPVAQFEPPPAAAPQPSYSDIESLPDADDSTIRAPTLEEMAWSPPEPTRYEPPTPQQGYMPYGVPPPPASPPPSPPPFQQPMAPPPAPAPEPEEAQEGPHAGPRMEVKRKEREKKGLRGRFGLGRQRKVEAPASAPAPVEDFEPVGEEVAEFEPAPEAPVAEPQWGEPMPRDGFQRGYGQPVYGEPMPSPSARSLPPPPTLPPPPQAPPPRPYAPARQPEDLDSEEEVKAAFGYQPPASAEAVEEFSPVEDEVAEFEPEAEPVPIPEPTGEVPKAEEEGGGPLHAEKDIDKILAMALGKSPPPKSRPTARPGVREDLSSPISTLMSKTKYKPK